MSWPLSQISGIFLERSAKNMIERIAEIFGLPSDEALFALALTHPSYANENRESEDNQRLEFLGDAVLGLCISEMLFERYPEADEGSLTNLRAQLVNTEWLAEWGRSVGLSQALRLGRGAVASGLHISNNVVADAVEACVAATFLHSGLEGARIACTRIFESALEHSIAKPSQQDPKSELQQVVQALGVGLPAYEVVSTRGPAHERWFDVRVGVAGQWLAQGEGRSKRAAERAAAEQLLAKRETLLDVLAGDASRESKESEP
jgi:ribonuclease III